MSSNRIALSLVLAAACTGLASAQQQQQQAATSGGIRFSVNSSFEHQFEADLDRTGDVEVTRFHAGLGASMDLSRDTELSLRFAYDFDSYNFDGPVERLGNADDPWEDIHTMSFGTIFSTELTNDVNLFGGPVFQVSREEDADWDDAWIWGGVGGVSWRVSKDLVIGGGLGVVSQLQDDARVFPVFILDWHLSDRMRLTNRAATSAGGGTGLELIYELSDSWEVAFGARYEFRRFRLDDDNGVAPDGVGEETRFPMFLRVGYDFNDNISLNGFLGFTAYQEFDMEEADGGEFGSPEADVAALVGARVAIRF
jgi:hypothetical protein